MFLSYVSIYIYVPVCLYLRFVQLCFSFLRFTFTLILTKYSFTLSVPSSLTSSPLTFFSGMAASAPPNLLSDDKEKLLSCISEKTVPCVFNIEVNELIAKDKGGHKSKGGPSKGFSSSITGFAIAQRGNVITILKSSAFTNLQNHRIKISVLEKIA